MSITTIRRSCHASIQADIFVVILTQGYPESIVGIMRPSHYNFGLIRLFESCR